MYGMGPLDARTREGRMSFAELGEEFMRSVLTTELLTREFMAAIPPGGLEATETVEGFEVGYRAHVLKVSAKRNAVSRLHPQPAIHGYRFHFTADFKLALSINILGGLRESFEVSGQIPLTLEAQVYKPLSIHVAYEKLKEEQIQLTTEKGQWHNLAQRFGGLDDKVRRKVADRVNSILAGNEKQRTVDLLGMIQRALGERAGPP